MPDITSHIKQSKTIGWKGFHRTRAGVAVFCSLMMGKVPLKGVSQVLVAWFKFITPMDSAFVLARRGQHIPNAGKFDGVINTPTLDRIGDMGRYTQFHSTALCSPWM